MVKLVLQDLLHEGPVLLVPSARAQEPPREAKLNRGRTSGERGHNAGGEHRRQRGSKGLNCLN